MTRVSLRIAMIFGVALSAAAARAAEGDDAQWPSLGDDAQWPSVKVDETPINPRPHFIPDDEPARKSASRKSAPKSIASKSVEPTLVASKSAASKSLESKPDFAPETSDVEVTGSTAEWPSVKVDETPINWKPSFISDDEQAEKLASRKSAPKSIASKSAESKSVESKSVESKPAASKLVSAPETSHVDVTGSTAEWPSVKVDETPINPKPAFVVSEPAAKPANQKPVFAPDTSKLDVTGTSLAVSPKAPLALPEEPQPSAFSFEAGARYWYSFGNYRFAFSNGIQGFGTPTSTLDWKNLEAHSGEVFFRLDHKPTGFFVKGLVGGGAITSGYIDDKDFFEAQAKFSDTRSDVHNGSLAYAMIDIGWAYRPAANVKVGFFAGYHYWTEKATAYGLYCKQQQPALGCPQVGEVAIPYDVQVLRYEPTWHAIRLGAEAKVLIDDRWSVSGEIAAVPYASVENKDSHLLRQSYADLGPAPNVISKSSYAYGIEAEVFVDYAVTRNIEIGAGVRYWGLFARDGGVWFGPDFSTRNRLDNFDQQRWGMLAHIKGKF